MESHFSFPVTKGCGEGIASHQGRPVFVEVRQCHRMESHSSFPVTEGRGEGMVFHQRSVCATGGVEEKRTEK